MTTSQRQLRLSAFHLSPTSSENGDQRVTMLGDMFNAAQPASTSPIRQTQQDTTSQRGGNVDRRKKKKETKDTSAKKEKKWKQRLKQERESYEKKLQQQQAGFEEQMRKLEDRIQQLQAEAPDCKEQQRKLEERIQQQQERIPLLQGVVQTQQHHSQRILEQKKLLQEQLQKLRCDLQQQQIENQELNGQIAQLQDMQDDTSPSQDVFPKRVAAAGRTQLLGTQRELEEAKQQLQQLRADLQSEVQQKKKLESEVAEAKQNAKRELKEEQSQMQKVVEQLGKGKNRSTQQVEIEQRISISELISKLNLTDEQSSMLQLTDEQIRFGSVQMSRSASDPSSFWNDKEESDVDPEQSTGAGDSGSSGSSRDAAADEADDGLQNLSWTAESWLRSSKLLQTLAKSLLRKARRTKGGEDAKIKSLSLDNIRTAIHDAGIAEIVKSDVDELKEIENPDAAKATKEFLGNKKFAGVFEYTYAELDVFHNGLEGLIGRPSMRVLEQMRWEHTESPYAKSDFKTWNYGEKIHSPLMEWNYVFKQQAREGRPRDSGHEQGHVGWTIDDFMKRNGKDCVIIVEKYDDGTVSSYHGRTGELEDPKMGIERLQDERKITTEGFLPAGHGFVVRLHDSNFCEWFDGSKLKRHDIVHRAKLEKVEVIAGRLYTGPMYRWYNTVLRHVDLGIEDVQEEKDYEAPFDDYKRDEKKAEYEGTGVPFTTTIHVLNSLIIKLSKVQPAKEVYRGTVGGVLPQQFWNPDEFNIRGGIELAFMSTTTKRAVAMAYAHGKADDNKPSAVYVIKMGMIDRGADLTWCSQYPLEEEILFAPLTGLEVVGTPAVDSKHPNTIVIELRLNVNLHDATIEEVTGKMRKTHFELKHTVQSDLKTLGFPTNCMVPLDKHDQKYDDDREKDKDWFVAAENYKQATNDILRAKFDVCALVLQKRNDDSVPFPDKKETRKSTMLKKMQTRAAGILFNPADSDAMTMAVTTILLDRPDGDLLARYGDKLLGGKLIRLDLENRGITCILPEEVINLLGSAEYFNLSGNRFSNIIKGSAFAYMIYNMTNWKDVTELQWAAKQFSILPDCIRYCRRAKKICLSNNIKLISLPDEIDCLDALEELRLDGCSKLQLLPPTIGDLKNMIILQLKKCEQLTKLPETVGDLYKLRVLGLDGCVELQQLPKSIRKLKRLQKLTTKGCLHLDESNVKKMAKELPELMDLNGANPQLKAIISQFEHSEKSKKMLQNGRKCSDPGECTVMVSFGPNGEAASDTFELTKRFLEADQPTFCEALWGNQEALGGHGEQHGDEKAKEALDDAIVRALKQCKYLVALVSRSWCLSSEVKAQMGIILNRWKKDEVKVILVRYDSELPITAEENKLATILPYFDGNQDVFRYLDGKKNEDWITEVLASSESVASPRNDKSRKKLNKSNSSLKEAVGKMQEVKLKRRKAGCSPNQCDIVVSFADIEEAREDATDLATLLLRQDEKVFCAALWCKANGGSWIDHVCRGALSCRCFIALVTDGWRRSYAMKAVMSVILDRFHGRKVKVILVEYESESTDKLNKLSKALTQLKGKTDGGVFSVSIDEDGKWKDRVIQRCQEVKQEHIDRDENARSSPVQIKNRRAKLWQKHKSCSGEYPYDTEDLAGCPPDHCEVMVSYNTATSGEDAIELTNELLRNQVAVFCTALWAGAKGGQWVDDVTKGSTQCKYLIALVTDGWCRSAEVKAEMRIILNRWKADQDDPKVILVRYDSELDDTDEENRLNSVLPFFAGNQDVFYHTKKGVKNPVWIDEVLRLVDVDTQPAGMPFFSKPKETRSQETKRLYAEAKQLKKRAVKKQDDYDILLDTLAQCKEVLKILDAPTDVHENDVVTIRAINTYDGISKATITGHDEKTVSVKYEDSVTSNPVTAGRRSGATKEDGTKTFCLTEFQKYRVGSETTIEKNVKVQLKPTSRWTGLFKVTVIDMDPDQIKVQYEEKDRMKIGGKVDDGYKTFSINQFYDLVADELPLLADCLTTAAYAGGTAAYQGLEYTDWKTKKVRHARHTDDRAQELLDESDKHLARAVEIYTKLDSPQLPNARKQQGGSYMNKYKSVPEFEFGDVEVSGAEVRALSDKAIETFREAIREFEAVGENALEDEDYIGCFNNIGYVYKHRGEMGKAEEWWEEAKRKQKEVNELKLETDAAYRSKTAVPLRRAKSAKDLKVNALKNVTKVNELEGEKDTAYRNTGTELDSTLMPVLLRRASSDASLSLANRAPL